MKKASVYPKNTNANQLAKIYFIKDLTPSNKCRKYIYYYYIFNVSRLKLIINKIMSWFSVVWIVQFAYSCVIPCFQSGKILITFELADNWKHDATYIWIQINEIINIANNLQFLLSSWFSCRKSRSASVSNRRVDTFPSR